MHTPAWLPWLNLSIIVLSALVAIVKAVIAILAKK